MAAEMSGASGSAPGMMAGMMPGAGGMPTGMPIPGMPSPMIGSGGASMGGPQVENQPPQDQGLQAAPDQVPEGILTPDSPKDAEPGDPQFIEQPWFARLPPAVRKAISSNARRRFPRGYEDRLKRYFESAD